MSTAKSTANVVMQEPAAPWSVMLLLEDLSSWLAPVGDSLGTSLAQGTTAQMSDQSHVPARCTQEGPTEIYCPPCLAKSFYC